MITVVVHILNEDPIIANMAGLPDPFASIIIIQNPRLRDGKPVSYLNPATDKVIWPLHRINYLEVLQVEEEDDIISHVRE